MVDMADNRIELKFRDRTVPAKPLEPSQITLLSLLNVGGGKDSTSRTLHMIFRVLENRVGPEEWALIEADMVSGGPMDDYVRLINDLIEATTRAHQDRPADPEDAEMDAKIKEAQELIARHATVTTDGA